MTAEQIENAVSSLLSSAVHNEKQEKRDDG